MATLGHQSGVTVHPRNSALKSESGTPLPQGPHFLLEPPHLRNTTVSTHLFLIHQDNTTDGKPIRGIHVTGWHVNILEHCIFYKIRIC